MSATNRIIDQLVPEWIDHQSRKAIDYNSRKTESGMDFEPAEVLGVKGQFAEVWRKIWKLKKAMWDGEELLQEQPREILLDLIGHCFLAIDMLDRQPTVVAAPAVFCEDCKHQAFLHREERQPEDLGCIGTGPGRACKCKRSVEWVNSSRSEPEMASSGDMAEYKRIRVDPDRWNELCELADRIESEGPTVLEREGFMVLNVFHGNERPCGQRCTGNTHAYEGDCNMRIRRRKRA